MGAAGDAEPRPAPRDPSPRALPLAITLALALHGLLLGVVALQARSVSPASAALRAAQEEPLIWVDGALEPLDAPPASGVTGHVTGPHRTEPAVTEPDVTEPPAAAEPRAVAAAPGSAAPASASQPRLAAVRRAASGAAPTPNSSATGADSAVGGAPAAGVAGSDGSEVAEAGAEGAPAAAGSGKPSLSLEALGIGKKNPFLTPPAPRTAAEARAELGRRIDHVLRSGLAQRDQELGLGPEGPAVAKVTELVMQSTTRPNTSALISLRTDASGEVVHVEVAEASGDTGGWNDVAAALQRSLRGKKLRVPTGTGGVTMKLRVDSREQLPSGADPGLAINVLGQEVKKGQGERSTRISLLEPKIVMETYQLSSSDPNSKIPVVGLSLSLFALAGDPTDIGAPARRVVHAHLVSLYTHPAASP